MRLNSPLWSSLSLEALSRLAGWLADETKWPRPGRLAEFELSPAETALDLGRASFYKISVPPRTSSIEGHEDKQRERGRLRGRWRVGGDLSTEIGREYPRASRVGPLWARLWVPRSRGEIDLEHEPGSRQPVQEAGEGGRKSWARGGSWRGCCGTRLVVAIETESSSWPSSERREEKRKSSRPERRSVGSVYCRPAGWRLLERDCN